MQSNCVDEHPSSSSTGNVELGRGGCPRVQQSRAGTSWSDEISTDAVGVGCGIGREERYYVVRPGR